MSDFYDVEGHVLYALRNAQVKNWPFPHFFVENVFPSAFYDSLMLKLAEKRDFEEVEGRYHGRAFGGMEDLADFDFMKGKSFLQEVCSIFKEAMTKHFEGQKAVVYNDLRLIRDKAGYFIGPHTDAAWKLVSLLFYLPQDDWYYEYGTSVYLPKDREFRCAGGPHHYFAHFDKIFTAPYRRNTCFGFFKTDNSFHGVEPLKHQFNRDVLLYNVYDQAIYLQTHKPSAEQQP